MRARGETEARVKRWQPAVVGAAVALGLGQRLRAGRAVHAYLVHRRRRR